MTGLTLSGVNVRRLARPGVSIGGVAQASIAANAGPTLDLGFVGVGALDSRIVYAGSGGTSFNAPGVEVAATTNRPRLDYDPLTHASLGALGEEPRTNIVAASANTTGTNWSSVGSPTITTASAGAPDGSATLNHWTRTTTGGSYTVQTNGKAAASLAYAGSIYAKAGTNGRYLALLIQSTFPNSTAVVFDLLLGTVGTITNGGSGFTGSATIAAVGGGLYRCGLTTPTSDTTTVVYLYYSFNSNNSNQIAGTDSASNSDGYVWGAQLEQAASVSSYIPTTSAAVTRAADVFTMPLGSWYRAGAGTLVIEAMCPALPGTAINGVAEFNDGTTNNRYFAALSASTGQGRSQDIISGAGQGVFTTANVITPGTPFKLGLAQTVTAATLCLNGGVVASQTWAGGLPALTQLQLGGMASLNYLNGWLRRLRYWPRALSAGELRQATT